MLLSDIWVITPLYGGLGPPWKASLLWGNSSHFPWGLWHPGSAEAWKYRVTILTREEWTRGPGTLPAVKELVWFSDWVQDCGGEPDCDLWAFCRQTSQYLKLQSFRLIYKEYYPVFMKFKLKADQRNMLVRRRADKSLARRGFFLFCYVLNINNRRCAKLRFSFHSIINFRKSIDFWMFPDIDCLSLW